MSYSYRVLNDAPRHYYPLIAGATAYNDATGRSNGLVIGTPVASSPLVVGGGNSMTVNGNDHFRFLTPTFYQETVNKPFSLEAWFKPIVVSGVKGIVGHLGTEDGITYDGDKISFATIHGAAGEARASWFPPAHISTFYALGVHTGDKNELYVNGTRVASVNLTPEQIAAEYSVPTAPGYIYAGHGPGTILVDSVAVYDKALTGFQAQQHFIWGREAMSYKDVVTIRGGEYWDFTDASADVAFDFSFDTDEEWADAQSASVRIVNNTIVPETDAAGLTLAGTWMGGFILSAITDTIDGSKIEYDGDGNFTIETSINNGTTWSPAVNGREVTGLGEGVATANKSLQVRVAFPAGEPVDTITKLRSLSIKLYQNRDVSTAGSSQKIVFTGPASLSSYEYQPIENSEFAGVEFYSGGYGTLDSLTGYRTLEFLVKANTQQAAADEWWHIFDYRPDGTSNTGYVARAGSASANWGVSGGVMYVDGKQTSASSDFALTPGVWYHVVFVMTAASSDRLLLNQNFPSTAARNMSIGYFAAYPQAMSASEASGLYSAHMGIPTTQIVEPTALTVGDSAVDTVKIYNYSWSTVGSG